MVDRPFLPGDARDVIGWDARVVMRRHVPPLCQPDCREGLMSYSFAFDPEEILGVGPSASLTEIKAAYHDRSKRYHPDKGGDPWAFRLVAQAYQILTTARVAERIHQEDRPREPARPQAEPIRTGQSPFAWQRPGDSDQARAGIRDKNVPAGRLVDVELFTIRYAISDPSELLMGGGGGERILSKSLNVSWPARNADPALVAEARKSFGDIVSRLHELVADAALRSSAINVQGTETPDQFQALVSYPTSARLDQVFQVYRGVIDQAGLGVQQWIRDLILPRDGS